ncbi:ribosomal RNA processing protein 1 homolog A-like isoform X3 [Polyodon spathula]|uniref:ribosomal RNA processing protein 1 homolog A-like isoform X3 n=1 Tax=Polyodon spathula TaxID=7913 RepID=UPI001B7F0473|nr:ribosomal RNA processing protein 1 homolog A-like isoform X3 [Polyodon spathula]
MNVVLASVPSYRGKMAPMLQSPEIQFAQKLASNEKPIRTRAIKKLRKYLSIRSQKPEGGFSNDELLKIWKGLFYCMWMQDKPLLQEELATVISRLIHSLQKTDAQYLFLETFLQTMNREWNGIDRLRLDKFYKLIRMVLRQFFELLKRESWDESLVERFGCILSTQVLSAASGAPSGIQFHILDIYMEELATVGAEELTAEENFKLIDPFCKIAAKTKDRLLLQAIAHSIFDEIVDQSPFAIEDLMKEVQQQGQNVSDDSENQDLSKSKKSTGRQLNGKEAEKEQNFEDDSEGTVEMPEDDEDIGPVLQFDYKAIADRLFELASRTSTPSQNRKIIYRLVKKFQDLNDGIFPQDEYPEEVSTDEDDDELFGSRRRMKKRRNTESLLEKSSETAKGKDKKKKEGKKMEKTLNGGVEQKKENTEASPAGTSTELKQPCATEESTETKAKKKKTKLKESSPKRIVADPSSNKIDGHTGEKRKKKKKAKEAVEDGHDQEDCLEQTAAAILSSRGKKIKKLRVLGVNGEIPCLEQTTPLEEGRSPSELQKNTKKTVELVQEDPAAEQVESSQTKKMMKKKKRKIEAANPAEVNGLREYGGKKKKKSCESKETVISVASKKPLQKTKASTEKTEFVRFENSSFPVPLFFKRANGGKPRAAKRTPESGSKKVTFGLNNNKTAEFKRTDKSILVSPEGTSRVAFDPQQKPLCGVLKSPLSVMCSRHKTNTPASTKKRATAADFF